MIDPFTVHTDYKYGIANSLEVKNCAFVLGKDWFETVSRWKEVYKICPVVIIDRIYGVTYDSTGE